METAEEVRYVTFPDVPEAVLWMVGEQLTAQTEEAEPVYSRTQEKHTCVRCKAAFDSLQEQRAHFRSEWHRLNLQVCCFVSLSKGERSSMES